MVEYIDCPVGKRFLTKVIEEEKRKRFQIVTDMIAQLEVKEIGVHEYERYILSIKQDEIQLVTPDKIYIKKLLIH